MKRRGSAASVGMLMADALATYLQELRAIKSSGAAVQETSYYGPLANLLNEVGKGLKPRVRCIIQLRDKGAGLPDGGLFTADQFPRSSAAGPAPDLIPARGVIEVKGTGDDVTKVADGAQVARYWERYGQVLVTNYRDFVLVGRDADGRRVKLESYRLAPDEASFWAAAAQPQRRDAAQPPVAEAQGERFIEYLRRVMLHAAPLSAPEDVARFLASYARDAKARIQEKARAEGGDLSALATVRAALEQALGIQFEGEKGEQFFRSTLVQTLFYGVFSAWVLWAKTHPPADRSARFNWHEAAWSLHVPMIRALFEQVATPSKLGPLDLVEVLDWTGAVLNRVDRAAFFARFEDLHAVQYFYEPFLQAFDPVLRKDLGVWYTPAEVVQYMVARVDTVLRQELGIADGLADPRVYVLDPCCGTGAFLVEVVRRIAAMLAAQGGDALSGGDLKEAVLERVFGFEILPAPFVVAHLQLGLLLRNLGAPLVDETERVGVYLTNALTGWEPPKESKPKLLFAEMEEEREAAERVKREAPILVILGNPPYNGFAGMAVAEERDLSHSYRTTKRAPAPQGQGLNDLYIRFFRMAERRIVERTGQGIVCFISNYSWLDGLSFTGMRERYLEGFDRIWIDCLNGDKYKSGKLTPDGRPDPSIFSTEWNREGIQIGTAIALLVRKEAHAGSEEVQFRHLWGREKRAELVANAVDQDAMIYQLTTPSALLGLPFMPMRSDINYEQWPMLPQLFPVFSPGVKTSRDLDLVGIDEEKLKQRMSDYFDASIGHEAMAHVAPSLMSSSERYNAVETRSRLIPRGLETGYFVRYSYQPFDMRNLYWHPETKLLDRKREALFASFQAGNLFLATRIKAERQEEGIPFYVTRALPDYHMTRPGSMCFPIALNGFPTLEDDLFSRAASTQENRLRANLSERARTYLAALGIADPDAKISDAILLWMHALAIGYSAEYLTQNGDGIRQDWPRIPLPTERAILSRSAVLGHFVARLLDPQKPVRGVTVSPIRPELKVIASITRVGGGSLSVEAGELAVTAGWGFAGKGGVCMPGKGKVVERDYAPEELAAIEQGAEARGLTRNHALQLLGPTTRDIYLNEVAYWRNVPGRVWDYTIGGYQVIKKWLSYRERPLLGRPLSKDEAREVMEMARRIAALLLLEPELDANYAAVRANPYPWPAT